MKKIFMIIFILTIVALFSSCAGLLRFPESSYHWDVSKVLMEKHNIEISKTIKIDYEYSCPTFTGSSSRFAVLSCSESELLELKEQFVFLEKDSKSTFKFDDFFDNWDAGKEYYDDSYELDTSKEYKYFVDETKNVWFALDESQMKLYICIFGH